VTVPATTTDGIVTLRPSGPGDVDALVTGRDDLSRRFLGEGNPDPRPVACIEVAAEVAGWVDWDVERTWLEPGEVNLGYQLFAAHRGQGCAARAVQLLLHRLALTGEHRTATLLIDPANERSLALAERLRFTRVDDLDGNPCWKRPVAPLAYDDGAVTIRRRHPADVERDLEAKDEEQIRWLWLPGERERWEAMTPLEQRAHAVRGLQADRAAFGTGPKWTFTVDGPGGLASGYVDVDLANGHVPHGEANVSYSTHPADRGGGVATRAVRLVLRFLREHTATREAHILVDPANTASLGVARAVGAIEREAVSTATGDRLVRFVLTV
jgi:RimJ/RimL family protein N-acetyltransferase